MSIKELQKLKDFAKSYQSNRQQWKTQKPENKPKK